MSDVEECFADNGDRQRVTELQFSAGSHAGHFDNGGNGLVASRIL